MAIGLLAGSAPPAAAEDDKTAAADIAEADRLEKEIERLARDGQHIRAIPLAEQALALREKRLGPDDPKVASALSDLGALCFTSGDLVRATTLLQRSAAILEKSSAATPLQKGVTLGNLAGVARARGDYEAARALGQRAVLELEKAGPSAEGDLASILRGLGLALVMLRNAKEPGEPVLERALEISRRIGKNELAVLILTDLGTIERTRGRAPQAADHYNEALALSQKTLGPEHPVVGNLLHRIGRFYHRDHNYEEAERYYQRASPILERAYGPDNPVMAELLADWSLLSEAAGDIPRAVNLRARANEIEQGYFDVVIQSGDEGDKQRFAKKLRRHLEDTIWLHAGTALRGKNNKDALRVAFTALLRMKGRVLDALADDMAVLRESAGPEERKLLDDLARTRSDLSALYVRGPDADPARYFTERRALLVKQAEIEEAMSARSAALRAATAEVTIEAVQAALPEGAALVEIVCFQPHDARAYSEQGSPLGPPRYIAYVLKRTGEPRFTLLPAQADQVDDVVSQVRAQIQHPDNNNVYDPAERLDRLFMRQVNALLGDTKDVFLSPDGKLSLVPFGALVEDGHLLIERYTYTYLTSGRDLLRLAARPPAPASRSAPMIFANPAYDKAAAPMSVSPARSAGIARRLKRVSQYRESDERESVDLSEVGYPRLPGTAAEAKAISQVVPGAVLRMGAEASEAALKDASGPLFLHIATHGFFFGALEHGMPPMAGARSGTITINDPLVRSGLALAGANLHARTGEDGVLTALEASALDLHGTELVVLSACETGVGEFTSGDGVRGLRRALVLAGAETQVMSLWKVDDDGTRALMTAFYQQLFREGAGRSEGMRRAQLELLRSKKLRHPYYWASFIVSGAPGPMSRDPRWLTAKVTPGPRGCSCEVAGEGEAPFAGWMVVGAIGALALLRRRRRD